MPSNTAESLGHEAQNLYTQLKTFEEELLAIGDHEVRDHESVTPAMARVEEVRNLMGIALGIKDHPELFLEDGYLFLEGAHQRLKAMLADENEAGLNNFRIGMPRSSELSL